MKTKFDITEILYSVKNINDLYYNLSVKVANECGITKPEADILAFLNNNPSCDTAKDIVRLKGFSKAYVSKAVEPLILKELIKVEVDKNDRRCQHLKLTEKSKPIVIKLYNMQSEFVEKITKGIDPKDIEKYIEVMHLFSENALK
ncbi:MarR family winged helix-turn-helix transcriptional regulator [Clostridium sp.]|uniref:MarR family winged helix-turn-helix transcriptional regulator n=1 Tax=Clostridium sp. TaxID=1506 RepID=UPI002632FC47|nr:MarR family winged helix-turn-helix transcriptional regulator [Clostridium sp.]MDO5779316.1 MarR family winged helix-turn-helix transcriptional regulator [Clostridium sp.]